QLAWCAPRGGARCGDRRLANRGRELTARTGGVAMKPHDARRGEGGQAGRQPDVGCGSDTPTNQNDSTGAAPMRDISRRALFGKLDSLSYKAVEGATVFCKLRGNPYVELVHWMHQVLQLQNSDLHCIIRVLELDAGKVARDFTTSLDRLPRGATAISDLSPHLVDAVERAWIWATLKFRSSQIRSGHVLLACLNTPALRSIPIRTS